MREQARSLGLRLFFCALRALDCCTIGLLWGSVRRALKSTKMQLTSSTNAGFCYFPGSRKQRLPFPSIAKLLVQCYTMDGKYPSDYKTKWRSLYWIKSRKGAQMTDFHIHSSYSDGSMTPADILAEAEQKGLKFLSVTDHNNVGAYRDLMEPAVRKLFSGEIITGCELSTTIHGETVEILGYGFDVCQMQKFIEQNYITDKEQNYRKQLDIIYDSYMKLGVKFNRSKESFDVKKDIGPKRFFYSELLAPENHKLWLDANNRESFSKYLRNEIYNSKSPLFIDHSQFAPAPLQVAEAIHQAGGKAFLAHCFLYSDSVWGNLKRIVDWLRLDGIECYYPAFSQQQKQYLVDFCQHHNLLISGGSDFHGAHRPENKLGCEPLDAGALACWQVSCYKGL